MRQLNFAAQPNYIQEFREVQRLFRQDLAVPMRASLRGLLEQTMRDAVANQVQAGWHERQAAKRAGYRNGTYQRRLLTTVGAIVLDVPRTREHPSPVTEVVERYQRRMPEIDAMIQQVFLRGVSTRQTGAVLAALCGETVSATSVSRLTGMLEASAQAFHTRPLADHYRYLLMDGVYLRIREAGGVRRRLALCVYGISGEGVRELIDFRIARAESQSAWEALLNSLYERGLRARPWRWWSPTAAPGCTAPSSWSTRTRSASCAGPTRRATSWTRSSSVITPPVPEDWRRSTAPRAGPRPDVPPTAGRRAGSGSPRPRCAA